jgi:hypothetical protein
MGTPPVQHIPLNVPEKLRKLPAKSALDSVNNRDRVKEIFIWGPVPNLMGWFLWSRGPMEKLYSVRDIQRLFGFKVGRIRYWDKIGFLTPSVKIGPRKYYTSQDLMGLRTAKGLLDANLSFTKVRRSVIDAKKISWGAMKPPSQLLVHRDGKEGVFDPRSIRFSSKWQSLIGFSQGDFERGMRSANIQFERNFTGELEESGTARETPPGKQRSIRPTNP